MWFLFGRLFPGPASFIILLCQLAIGVLVMAMVWIACAIYTIPQP
jgi:hypothetical protein